MSAIVSDSSIVQLSTSDIGDPRYGILAEQAPQAEALAAASSGFDYAALPAAVAENLRKDADRLRGLIRRSTADLIEIGIVLLGIKGRLKHGQFTNWIEREIGISVRTAQNFMAVAKWADGKSEAVSLLPPSTVRMLAAKSAPLGIIERVIARAGFGDIVPDVPGRYGVRGCRA